MSRGPHQFRQGDLAKALKAAAQAGLAVARFEITTEGKIVVIAGRPGQDERRSEETSADLRGLL